MADMRWKFLDAYTKVGQYLGLALNIASDVTKAKEVVYRGYMKFLSPINPKESETYVWSFLRQPWKITLESNKWEYPVPKDFERFYRRLEYDDSESAGRMEKTTEQRIMSSRRNLEFDGYPSAYAIRTGKFDKVVGSLKELIVYPTPSARSMVNSTYVMTPAKPEADGDYFIGGPIESECILQCCLAIAENQEDEKIGVETQRAVEMIQTLIRKDKGVAPDTVGFVHDGGINQGSVFDYRKYWIPSGTMTVYGQEL